MKQLDRKFKIFNEHEVNFILQNYNKLGASGCKKFLQTDKSIKQICNLALRLNLKVNEEVKKLNLKIQKKFNNFKVPSDNFKKNLTPESVYLLGLIWADGHIPKNKYSEIRFSSTFPDADYFYKIFLTTGNWNLYRKKLKESWKESCVIQTSNRDLANFFKDMGYCNKSIDSPDLILQHLPDNLIHYWFLGLSDGDGYFYKHKKYNSFQWNVTSTVNQDWSYLIKLSEKLNIKYKINIYKSKTGSFSRFRIFSFSDVKILVKFLYQNYLEDKIGLPRKFEVIQNLLLD